MQSGCKLDAKHVQTSYLHAKFMPNMHFVKIFPFANFFWSSKKIHFVKMCPFTKIFWRSKNAFCENFSLYQTKWSSKHASCEIFSLRKNFLDFKNCIRPTPRRKFRSGAAHPAPRLAILSSGNTTFGLDQYFCDAGHL